MTPTCTRRRYNITFFYLPRTTKDNSLIYFKSNVMNCILFCTERSRFTPMLTAGSVTRTPWCPMGTGTVGTVQIATSTMVFRRWVWKVCDPCVLFPSHGCELSLFPFVLRSAFKDLLFGWCALSAEWGLQQTHPSTVHGASEPWCVWWTSYIWDTQVTSVGQLSDAVM